MKSLTTLWQYLALDMGELCGTCTDRDLVTLRGRVETEGLSFLTITLASFGKDFEKSLSLGGIGSNQYAGFKRVGGLPAFLRGFLCQVFDAGTGVLLEFPSSDAVFAVRQLTLSFSKINLPCSERRTKAAFDSFLECEKDLKSNDQFWSTAGAEHLHEFTLIATLLFGDVFDLVQRKLDLGQLIPKHGPGATAEKVIGNAKYRQLTWPDRLERVFPYVDYALPSVRHHQVMSRVEFLEPGSEMPVRVIAVPKTLKTPRLIAIEPVAMQYMQQALMEPFVESLESHLIGGKRSHIQGMLGFTDQTPNQDLAREGSLKGTLATLDLSEASDRVSNQLVIAMFKYWPDLSEAVQACRSRKADVLGAVHRLSKFASMGSALTFPVEAMVFLAIVIQAMLKAQDITPTRYAIQRMRGLVRIYGDDIIVPVDSVPEVIGNLESFGFKVNADKSFWTGRFRESCGKEYYDGHDVSIVKVRSVLPASLRDVSELVSTVSFRNQCYFAGMWKTARYLDELLEGLLRDYPLVEATSPVLGRHSFLPSEGRKLDADIHIPLVKGYVVRSPLPENSVDDVDALLKWFLKRGDLPFADKDHLERSGRPLALQLKRGWYSLR